jgi:LuxR family maltose regulon positive regulatory protein
MTLPRDTRWGGLRGQYQIYKDPDEGRRSPVVQAFAARGLVVLVETKLRQPVLRDGLVERDRLLKALDGAWSTRLAVISAPAGFGKSTLLGQWICTLRERGASFGWLALDQGDDDLGRFLTYLVAALRRADPELARGVPVLLESSPVLPVDSVLTTIVNDLSGRSQPLFLILDDCHFLTSPEIGRFIEGLLAYAPPCLHLVVATRGAVPFQLANVRVKGQLIKLDDTHLRFSLEEAESFLNHTQVLDLPIADIVTLQHRTEGWAAGLQLASLSLEQREERADFIRHFSGSHRDVAEFLAQDVLARQSAATLDFLLETSVLTRISAPLADAVLGRQDAADMLAAIESANLFLIPLDRERNWFRYHHLFAEFLQSALRQRAPKRLAELHRRAADWLSAQGQTSEAVVHALAAGESDRAAALVEDCALPMIMQSHLTVVRQWLNLLPGDLIARRPRLQLAQVWIQFHMSRPQEGARTLKAAKQSIAALAESGTIDVLERDALRAELCTLTVGVISAADRSRTAARLAAGWMKTLPEDKPFFRGTLGNIHAFCCYSLGDMEGARAASTKARDAHAQAQSVFGLVYCDLILGLTEKSSGELAAAHRMFERAAVLARGSLGPGSYAEAMVAIFQVELLYEWNELAAAERLLHTHRQIIEECGLVVHEMACKLHIARLAAARGRHDEAIAVLERAERQGLEKRYRRLTASALNDRVRLLLGRGDARSARRALQARGIGEGNAPEIRSIADELEAMALARVLIAEDRPDAALRVVDTVADRARRDGRMRRFGQARALAAIAAHRAGDTLTALAAAVDTVSLAAPQNAFRMLIDEGAALHDVLAFARARMPTWTGDSRTGRYIELVMQAFARTERDPVLPGLARRNARFSQREAEVARLLTAGHSNRALANSLGMAPDTVKWHLKNIFGKLGVSNRTQAVLRLQEIGIRAGVLPPQ